MSYTKDMVEFRETNQTSSREFHDAMDIYVGAFPSNERHPVSVIGERISRGLSKLSVGTVGNEVVFLALLWPLPETDFILLDYLATKDGHRGKGIASAFIRKMQDEVHNAQKYLILEVENPRFGTNTQEREKRVGFYRRLGARELHEVGYLLPPLDGDKPTEMILMILPGDKHKEMSGNLIKRVITKMYRDVYGRDEGDALLSSVIDQIRETVSVI